MKIKRDDIVTIKKGKDRGKTGKVLRVDEASSRITVEGLNLVVKHLRPRRAGEKGQRIQFPAALAISNVAAVCPKCSRATRVGFQFLEGRKVRFCKKCKSTFT